MATTFEDLLKKEDAKEVPIPERLQKKSFVRKAGEFVAPTATGLLTGEKELGLRTGAGAALEAASFIPAVRLARLGAMGLRAFGAAKLASRAKKTAQGLTTAERAVQTGRQIGGAARIGLREGALGGGLFETGRALGEEETPFGEVAKRGAIGAGFGAVTGAALLPATQVIGIGTRTGASAVSRGFRTIKRGLPPAQKQEAVNHLTQSYELSFLDRSSINSKLDVIAQQARRQKGPNTPEAILREFAEEGFVPEVRGKFANLRPVLDELAKRRGDLANRLDEFLKPIKKRTTLKNLKQRAVREVQEDFAVDDINKALSKIDNIVKAVQRKFGRTLSATDINQIRKEMNEATKRFFEKERIQDDALIAIANATRQILDEVAPSTVVRGINNEIGRLFRMDKVARVFNNKKIDPGFVGTLTGKFLGTVAGAGAGLSLAGPGGLVIAGGLASIGSEAIAKMIRGARFNSRIQEIIRRTVNQNQALKNRILKEAKDLNKADRTLLEKVFK